jgi:photosystem II stability/assembly factor-like uncharacterized protein
MNACSIAGRIVALALVSNWAIAQVWEEVSLPGQFAQGYYLDVFVLPSNPQYVWACGYNGYVVRSTNGGSTWQGSIVPYNGRMGGHLESVHFLDPFNGYTSGPAGVFRSTDGGATWVDITPQFPSEGPWGCYFLSTTTGVVLGGGCAGPQNFFRTTNGGQSWTLFQGNQTQSGLTDAILFANGTGYAVSSGFIWQTTDSGGSWSVIATSGPAYWNEEITVQGTSFLIPWAGSTCSGQGNGGGGRFSTDGGQSWRSFSTGVPMFGAFLLDAQRGWICGFARQVWYTSDAGQQWQYRGCGTRGDLDDIWMVNDTTGFVVGDGIYRYARAQRTATKTALNFGSLCPPVVRFDTLFVRNRSWNSVTVTLRITGSDSTAFAIVAPSAQPAGIPSCDSLMLVVRYMPTRDGVHRATLRVETANGESINISLQGERLGRTVAISDTLVSLVGVPSGQPVRLSVAVLNSSSQQGFVTSVTKVSGDNIQVQSNLPLAIPPGGGALEFAFTPPDTGWYEALYRIRMEPCSYDTLVRVRLYARSPIINARAPVWNSACGGAVLDSIRIVNTGNAELQIAALWLEPSDAPFVIVGSSRGGLPIVVPPKDTVHLFLRFAGQGSGSATLVIEHNDGTLVRNVARPLRVTLQYTSDRPLWGLTPDVLDFGTLCVGQSRVLFVEFANRSTFPIEANAITQPPFSIAAGSPFVLAPSARLQVGVAFTPQRAGTWSASLILGIEPCDLHDTVLLRGRAETSALALDPLLMRLQLRTGETRRVPIVISSIGTARTRVFRAVLEPQDARWQIESRMLPFVLQPDGSDTLWIVIKADSTGGALNGKLCVQADSLCAAVECLTIECTIVPEERYDVRVEPSEITFAPQFCQPSPDQEQVRITNRGTESVSITTVQIEPPDAPFRILGLQATPFVLNPDETANFFVEYTPSNEGVHMATLVIRATRSMHQVPLKGSYENVVSRVDPLHVILGVLEPCSELQEVHFQFYSQGTIGDTLLLRQAPSSGAWRISPQAQRVPIAPGSSTSVTVHFDPSQVAPGTATAERFVWESSVCPVQLIATVEYTVIRAQLAYDPTVLQWDDAVQNSTVTRTVRVWNPSPIARTVIGYEVVTMEGDAQVQITRELPVEIEPGQEHLFTVAMTPRTIGSYRAMVRLIERSACQDTAVIELRATVAQELYRGRLSISTHVGLVGDTLRVPVLLTTRDSSVDALWRAMPEAIGFTLTFNDFVIAPLAAYAGNPLLPIPIEVEPGTVHVRVPRRAVRLLGASDTLAVLLLWGMQSPPLRTELHFSRSWMETEKAYLIEHDDGMVVLDACVPWMKVTLSDGVRFRIDPHPIEEGGVAMISFDAHHATRLRCRLLDVQGRMQWDHEALITGTVALPLPSLVCGVYLLRVDSEQGDILAALPILVIR